MTLIIMTLDTKCRHKKAVRLNVVAPKTISVSGYGATTHSIMAFSIMTLSIK